MDNSLLERAKNIEGAFVELRAKHTSILEQIEAQNLSLTKSKTFHQEQTHNYEILEKSVEVMKLLVGEVSKFGIEKLKGLLTYGLTAIFEDRQYSIDIEISERGDNKTAEFYLIENKEGKILRSKLRDSVGGGIQTVVALIIQVYFIMMLDLRRVLVMDESLSAVSEIYVDSLMRFMRQIVKELGFKILWVTHDSRFIDQADRLYQVTNGKIKQEKKDVGD